MKLRQFLASIPAALFSAKAIALAKPVLVPPQPEFRWDLPNTSPVGLWAQSFNYDKRVWNEPYLILCEFDEIEHNPYHGEHLNNARRNKYWGRGLVSKDPTLLCFDRWDTGLRFFKDAPNTDWSTVYPV